MDPCAQPPRSGGFLMPESTNHTPDHDVDQDTCVHVLPVVIFVITPEEYAAMLAEDPLNDDGEVC